MRLHTGVYRHRKRVCTESWLWDENLLPHRGIEPASAAWWSNAVTNWATSHPHTSSKVVWFLTDLRCRDCVLSSEMHGPKVVGMWVLLLLHCRAYIKSMILADALRRNWCVLRSKFHIFQRRHATFIKSDAMKSQYVVRTDPRRKQYLLFKSYLCCFTKINSILSARILRYICETP